MSSRLPAAGVGSAGHSVVFLSGDRGDDAAELAELRADPAVEVIDHRGGMTEQLRRVQPAVTTQELAAPGCWVYYPWRRTLVWLLGPVAFRRLRLDRNRNKITASEQEKLSQLTVGVVGLSVGHAIAHTLALEGLCGQLRLADFDALELSNLNRIPATVLDVGINKAVVTARRIAELDPYLTVKVFEKGLTDGSMDRFFHGVDLIVEECDSLDMKVRIRQEAKARGIPVLMDTSDRGLFDVERFDLDPDLELVHGLLGELDPQVLAGLPTRDKAPFVMRILQTEQISPRLVASMMEIDRSVSTWPQLGGDVQLGAATVAAAVRRFGLGGDLRSGRVRVDIDTHLDGLRPPQEAKRSTVGEPVTDLTVQLPTDPLEALIHAVRIAPSGGNVQPWSITVTANGIDLTQAAERTSALDVKSRASQVAIGAAVFNARVAAARHSAVGPVEYFPHGGQGAVAALTIASGTDADLARHYPAMVSRITNRNFGVRAPLTPQVSDDLYAAADSEGAHLHLVTEAAELARLADLLAESDRIRYLTPRLHQQMMSEIRWPGVDRLDQGIDVRTLGLDATDTAKLQVAGRAEVMAHLASWNVGSVLGDGTRDRVNASSALAVVTVKGESPRDYLRGGSAMQRVWITATHHSLAVQPVSPIFIFARTQQELSELSPDFAAELTALQSEFGDNMTLRPAETTILVLRLSHAAPPALRSERLARNDVVHAQ